MRARFVVLQLLVGLGSIIAFDRASAICPPGVAFFRYVGNKASDAQCTDDTIQSAIDAVVCPATTIVVTRERTWSGQHLTINNKTFTLAGSTGACGTIGTAAASPSAVPTAPVVTLSGAGNSGHSVIDITGNSNITLQYLEITGGSGGSGSHGGGIDFNGTGSLTLDTDSVDLNSANFGGGIEINGNGGDATLTLKSYSIVESNTASGNGGGINLDGFAQLIAVQPFTLIGFNHAPNGDGGGIAVVSPARADIGSPGDGGLAVVYGNDAALGGGLAALGANGNAEDATINLYTADAASAVGVASNFASQAGGGIYLKPEQDFGGAASYAQLCARDFHIDDNAAPEGAAIFADNDSAALASGVVGSVVRVNSTTCGASPGALACPAGETCNTMNGNVTMDAAHNATPGAAIALADGGSLTADRFTMRSNQGAHALRTVSSLVDIRGCLIADNTLSGEMLFFDDVGDGGSANVFDCTIVNNAHNSGSVIRTALNVTLDYDILDQPVMASVSKIGTPAIFADDVLAADPTGLPVQPNIIQGEPLFVDATNATVAKRNYHQAAYVQAGNVTASLGIDFAPPVSGDDRDLDSNPYDQDVPSVTNAFGVRDLGCYEAQPIADRIFADAFGDAISLVY